MQPVVLSELQVIFAEPPANTVAGFKAIVNRGLASVESEPSAACARKQAAMQVVSSFLCNNILFSGGCCYF